jgi:hypothetical protein
MNWKQLLLPLLIVLVDVVEKALTEWLSSKPKTLPPDA